VLALELAQQRADSVRRSGSSDAVGSSINSSRIDRQRAGDGDALGLFAPESWRGERRRCSTPAVNS
jgi:hypothetical protein